MTRKLTLALVLGILVVLGGNAAIRVRRELSLFETDSRRDSLLIGRMLAGSVARIWPTAGQDQALDLVADANERESTVRIRFIWLDVTPGEPEGPDLEVGADAGAAPFARVAADGDDEGALYTYVPVMAPKKVAATIPTTARRLDPFIRQKNPADRGGSRLLWHDRSYGKGRA